MGAIRPTAKSILPINSVICYVHFLKKNFIEIDELEFRRGFKSVQKVLLKANAVRTVPITAKTPSKVQRENKQHPPSFLPSPANFPASRRKLEVNKVSFHGLTLVALYPLQ